MKVPRPAVKVPADSVPVKIRLAGELELIGYRVDALPTASRPLQLTLWWRGVQPATEDWTAFFHLTPLGQDAELLGQMDQAITGHAYPPTVWAADAVSQVLCIFRLLRVSVSQENRANVTKVVIAVR